MSVAQPTQRLAGSNRVHGVLDHWLRQIDVDQLSRKLDTAFRIPGTPIRFGWDSILGLVPGVGDGVTAVLAMAPVVLAWREGASRWLLVRMMSNVAVDSLVGAVPVVGDLFDLFFKANRRNARHLERFRQTQRTLLSDSVSPSRV